jgi:hypothetical protein
MDAPLSVITFPNQDSRDSGIYLNIYTYSMIPYVYESSYSKLKVFVKWFDAFMVIYLRSTTAGDLVFLHSYK